MGPDRRDRLRRGDPAAAAARLPPAVPVLRGRLADPAFRGLPDRPDDWWSEDWVGSCTQAGNDDPEGRPQGLSTVDLHGVGTVTLGGGRARRCPRRWSAPTSPSAGGRSPASWSSCSPRLARCRCTPTRRGTGRGATSARRSARPRRGSCWTRPGTGRAGLRGDRVRARHRPGLVRRRGAPPRQRGDPRHAAPNRGPARRGVRGTRRRAALPRPADLVHRGPGAHRSDRDPGDRRRRRRRARRWGSAGTWPST